MIERVLATFLRWLDFADQAGFFPTQLEAIGRNLQTDLKKMGADSV